MCFIAFIISSPFTNAHNPKTLLKFKENKNQWSKDILFKADIPNGSLYLKKSKFVYHFQTSIEPSDTDLLVNPHYHSSHLTKSHVFEVKFLKANKNPILSGLQPYPEKYNYYKGRDSKNWATRVNAYGKIQYENLYKGINLQIYQHHSSVKYEFVVDPHSRPSSIKLKYNGVDSIYVLNEDLYIHTSVNIIVEKAPYAYQVINDTTYPVKCNYQLAENVLSFNFPDGYNENYSLIIDPELVFSSFSGSRTNNWGNTATYDSIGNAYTAGILFGGQGLPDVIGSSGDTIPISSNGFEDIMLMKFNPDGTDLLYTTYIGGSRSDIPLSLITDDQGNLFMVGVTGSNDFPTSETAYQRNFNGGPLYNMTYLWSELLVDPFAVGISFDLGTDLFVMKIDNDGTIDKSTLIGGSDNDGVLYTMEVFDPLTKNYGDQFRADIILDEDENIYVASHTTSTDFPTVNPSQNVYGGGLHDAVFFKFSPELDSLLLSSYYGGTEHDASYSIKIDGENNIIIGGGTTSPNLQMSTSSLNSTYGGNVDGFIAKFNASGTLQNATYLGTTSYDQVYFIDIDGNDRVYALGQTVGSYPVTDGSYSNNGGNQFIHKLNSSLDTTQFSTVFGSGNGVDLSLTAFLISECENIFLAGWGGEVNDSALFSGNIPLYTGHIGGDTYGLPITQGAFQSSTDGSDFYLMVLEKNAESLLYATYFGGTPPEGGGTNEHVDGGTSRFDKRGIIYQAVCGGCGSHSEFPTTNNAWSTINQSPNCNNAIFKFDLTILNAELDITNGLDGSTIDSVSCFNEIIFKNQSEGGIFFDWDFGDGTTFTTVGKSNPSHTYKENGSYEVSLVGIDLATCVKRDTVKRTIQITGPEFVISNNETICKGDSIPLFVFLEDSSNTVEWSPDYNISSTDSTLIFAKPEIDTEYTVLISDTGQCFKTSSVLISVEDVPIHANFEIQKANSGGNINGINAGCSPLNLKFINTSVGETLPPSWNFGDGTTSESDTVFHTFFDEGLYQIRLRVVDNACFEVDDTVHIVEVLGKPSATFPLSQEACYLDTLPLSVVTDASNNISWQPALGLSSTNADNISLVALKDTTYYVTVTDNNSCTISGTFDLNVFDPINVFSETEDSLSFCITTLASLTIDGGEFVSYEWSPIEGVDRFLTIEDTGTYYLTVVNDDGCTATDSVIVVGTEDCPSAVFVPTIFTPNKDGENDVLEIFGGGYSNLELSIYNRWGELIFFSNNPAKKWDGTYKNLDVPVGVYPWIINYEVEEMGTLVQKTTSGDVTLVR